MKTLRMMLLALAVALAIVAKSQDVQFIKQTFFADKNLVFSGMTQGADKNIYVCTSKESFPEDHSGVAIRRMSINGDLIDKIDLKLDMVQNFALTTDGGYIVLFNYDMFGDAEAVKREYYNSQEYYMSERAYGNMPGVIKVSKYGSLDWVIELNYAEYFNDNDESSITALPDNHYWVIFNYSAEDTTSEFGAQNEFTRVVLVDNYGKKVVEKDFPEKDYGLLHAPVLLEDGRILLFSDADNVSGGRKLAWLDRSGNLTQSDDIQGLDGLYAHSVIAAGDQGYVYTGHQDEKDYMALVDRTGKLKWKNPTSGIINAMAADEKGILALSSEKYTYSYKDADPVPFSVTRYAFDGTVNPVMSLTTEGPVEFRKMITTSYSLVLAGDMKQGDKKGVAAVVTIPLENADIFMNMNTYNYKEYAKAVEKNDVNRIRALAAFGISPVFEPGTGGDIENEIDNPLLLAFKLGYYDIAERLLAGGADPDRTDKMPVRYFIYETPQIYNLPLTPLMYIALTPDFYDAQKYMDLLKKYNADFTKITRDGNAFDQAFKMQYTSFMDLYIKYVTLSSSDLERKMESAIENNLPVSLKWTLDHGADPSVRDYMGDVIIEKGLENGSKEVKAVLKEWQKTHKK